MTRRWRTCTRPWASPRSRCSGTSSGPRRRRSRRTGGSRSTTRRRCGAARSPRCPGAEETFAALRAAGIKVCLATGFSPATRDALLDTLGWRPLIDLALSPADAGRGRPWPDLPLTALLRLGGGAVSELAVAGDTASDVESGLRAGAGLVAGVLTGSGSREDLEKAEAPVILDSIADLLPLLGTCTSPPLIRGRSMIVVDYPRYRAKTNHDHGTLAGAAGTTRAGWGAAGRRERTARPRRRRRW